MSSQTPHCVYLRDDSNDSFLTLDEVSVICRAVICQVITIKKAGRHYDPIMPLLNHCMGVKGGVGEKWTDSTPKTIKGWRIKVKSKNAVI